VTIALVLDTEAQLNETLTHTHYITIIHVYASKSWSTH